MVIVKKVVSVAKNTICCVLFAAIASLLVISCDIGLGSQVDTATPSAAITYPDQQSYIRGKFIIAGTCSDDMGVEKVTVTIEKTDSLSSTKTTIGSTDAVISDNGAGNKKGAWSLNMDPDSFNGQKLTDGSYIVSVYASDKSGHSSSELSLAIDIDNHAPVFILKTPATTGDATAKAYGREVKLAGDFSDDHDVTDMKVAVYDSTATTLITTFDFAQTISFTSNDPFTIARYYTESEATDTSLSQEDRTTRAQMRKNYLTLYPTADSDVANGVDAGDKTFYCTIQLTDNARTYNDTSITGGVAGGNTTADYYVRTTAFYQNVLSETKAGANYCSLAEIKNILNGTSTKTDAIQNAVKAELAKIEIATDSIAANKNTNFSINPHNNPTFEVTGWALGTTNNTQANNDSSLSNYGFRTYEGGDITIHFYTGKDEIDVDPTSIKINVIEYENITEKKTTADVRTIQGLLADTLRTATADPDGSYSIKISKDNLADVYASGHMFKFEISGSDIEENSLCSVCSEGYGLYIQATTVAPKIIFDTTSGYRNMNDLVVMSGSAFEATTESSGFGFSGTVTLDADGFVVSNTKHGFVVNMSLADSNGVDLDAATQVVVTPTVSDAANKVYHWSTYLIPSQAQKTAIKTAGLYILTVSIVATDHDNNVTTVTRTIYVDNEPPVISLNSVSPIVNQKYVNGTVTVSGGTTDNKELDADNVKIEFICGTKVEQSYVLGKSVTWAKTFDTTTVPAADGTELVVRVTAVDKAGNKTVTTDSDWTYTIDQTTDAPVPTFTNADTSINTKALLLSKNNANSHPNIFGSQTNNSLTFSVTDDDGISSIVVQTRPLGTETWTKIYDSASEANKANYAKHSTSYNVSTTLPATQGQYDVQVRFGDYLAEQTGYNSTTTDFVIAVDDGKPDFAITTGNKKYFSKNGTVTIEGTVSDTAAVTVVRTGFAPVLDAATLVTVPTTVTVTGSAWTDTFTGGVGDATLTYVATDAYGYSETKTITYLIDTTPPTFMQTGTELSDGASITSASANYTKSGSTYKYHLSGTWADGETGSGTKNLYYSTASTSRATAEEKAKWTTVSTIASATVSGSWSVDIEVGQSTNKTIALCVDDNAGNESAVVSYTNLKFDYDVPVITTTASVDTVVNAAEQIAVSGAVVDSLSMPTTAPYGVTVTATKDGVVTDISSSVTITSESPEKATFTVAVPSANNTGVWKITVNAKDLAGQTAVEKSFTYTVDAELPTIAFTNTDARYAVKSVPQTFDGTMSDNKAVTNVYYMIKTENTAPVATDSGWTSASINTETTWSFTVDMKTYLANTPYYLFFKAKDDAGNATVCASKATVTLDDAAPVISALAYTLGGSALSGTTLNAADQTKTFAATATVTDTLSMGSANGFAANVTPSIKLNNSAVALSAGAYSKTTSDNDTYTLTNATYGLTVKEVLSTVGTQSVVTVTYSFTVPANTNDGTWTFSLAGNDASGQSASAQSATLLVDTALPVINGFNIAATAKIYGDEGSYKQYFDTSKIEASTDSGTYSLRGTWSDVGGSGTDDLYYSWDGNNYTAFTGTASVTVAKTVAVDLPITQGKGKTLYLKATDVAGNTSAVTSFSGIAIDVAKPVVTIGDITTYTKKGGTFTLTVVSTDTTNGIMAAHVAVTAKKNGADITTGFTAASAQTSNTVVTTTITVSANDSTNDGLWNFTVNATDNADRTVTGTTLGSIIIDATEPTMNVITVGSKDYATAYYAENSLKVTGTVKEMSGTATDGTKGSGIDKINYYVTQTDTEPASYTSDFSPSTVETTSGNYFTQFTSTLSGFTAGENYLFLQPVDKAGNKGTSVKYTINVDQSAPSLSSLSVSGSVLTNALKPMTITGKANDDNGVASVTLLVEGKSGQTHTYSAAETTSSKSATASDWPTWTITIPTSDFTNSNGKKVTATVTDVAGNATSQTACTLIVDTAPPTYTISSAKSALNGVKDIKGTASDGDNTPASIRLYYSLLNSGTYSGTLDYAGGATTDTSVTPETYGWTPVPTTKGGSVYSFTDASKIYNWTFSSFDFTTNSKAAESNDGTATIYILPVIVDAAGNSNAYTMSYDVAAGTTTYTWNLDAAAADCAVDLNSDRPTVKFNNLAANNGYVKSDTGVNGVISDDDGVATFKVLESPIDTATNNTTALMKTAVKDATMTGTLTFTAGSTSADWSYVPSGVTDDNTNDGEKHIYLYIIDTDGSLFYTAYTASGSTVDSKKSALFQPKTQYKTATATDNSTVITFTTDNNSPTIAKMQIGYTDTKTSLPTTEAGYKAYNANSTTEYRLDAVSTSTVVGGNYQYIQFYITASDASGITAVEATITPKSGTVPTLVPQKISTVTASGITTTVWCLTTTIDIDDWGTGEASLEVKVTDGSGQYSKQAYSFLVDQDGPSVTVNNPAGDTEVCEDFEFSGITSDQGGAGVASIEWMIPTVAQQDASVTDETLIKAVDANSISVWQSALKVNSTALAWNFPIMTTSATYPSLTSYVYDSVNKQDITTYGSPDANNLYKLYVYYKVTDKVGNVAIDRTHYITYNPDADRPTASVTYPAVASNASYVTLGSSIRVYGAATDNTQVTKVYLQIDADGDGDYDSDDVTLVKSYGYSVVQLTSATQTTPVNVDISKLSATYASWWGIPVSGTNSWNLTINSAKEFAANTTYYYGKGTTEENTSLREIGIRVCSTDNNYKCGSWSKEVKVMIDQNSPAIGNFGGTSGAAPYLVQVSKTADVSTLAKLTAAAIATKTWISDMYVSYNDDYPWYLVTTAEDNSGVKDIAASGTTPGGSDTPELHTSTDYTSSTTYDSTKTTFANTKIGTYIWFKLDTASEGSLSYTVQATEKVDSNAQSVSFTYAFNVDKTAPTIGTLSGNGTTITGKTTPVVNSNGSYYTVSGTVDDAKSGFEKLAFYFVRTGTNYLYDPMMSYSIEGDNARVLTTAGTTANKVAAKYNGTDVPFYGTNVTGTTAANANTFAGTTGSVSGNSHIRVGGLIYIGGVYRTITAITSDTVTFDSTCSTAQTSAFFPYAQVVDNTSAEKFSYDSTGTYTSLTNNTRVTATTDDGDNMAETVTKAATTWSWDATILSDFIADGDIRLYVVAFDKADNISAYYIDTFVKNNAPRISKMCLATDLNADGKYEDNEFSVYDIGHVSGETDFCNLNTFKYNEVTTYDDEGTTKYKNNTSTRRSFIIKKGFAVYPEIVGGNGDLYYVFNTAQIPSETPATGTAGTTAVKLATQTSFSASTTYSSVKALDVSTSIASVADTVTATKSTNATDTGKWLGFSFWDSTDGLTVGSTTLYATVNVKLDVDQTDNIEPTASLNPFYWESLAKNSVYGSASAAKVGDLKGHIDLESDLPATFTDSTGTNDKDPKVSGLVTLTGSAYDETRLGTLNMKIDGISLNGGNVATMTTLATYSAKGNSDDTENWTLAKSSATVESDGWKFTILTSTLDQDGHTATWQLDLDTSKVTVSGTRVYALGDVKVLVQAKDAAVTPNASPVTSTTNTTAASLTPYYRMDVVPYITGITTSLSALYKSDPSVYARTAMGNYPVHENESIIIAGFNIQPGTSTVKVKNTSLGKLDSNSTVSTGDGASSGALVVTQNSIDSLNNKNTNPTVTEAADGSQTVGSKASYNSRSNGVNNNLLNDDVYLDIWQFKDAANPKNGKIQNVTMKISPKGRIGFSFSNAVVYFSAPSVRSGDTISPDNVYSQTAVAKNYGWFTNNSFCFDPYGYPYSCAQSPDTDSVKGAAFMQLFSRQTGKAISSMGLNENYQKIANSSRLEAIDIPIDSAVGDWNSDTGTWITDIDRTKSIAMCTSMPTPSSAPQTTNNEVTVHIAYYDNMTKQVRYRQGRVGTNPGDFGYINYSNHGGSLLDMSGYWRDWDNWVPGRNSGDGTQEKRIDKCHDSFKSGNQLIYRVAGTDLGTAYSAPYQVNTTHKGGQYVDLGVLPTTATSTAPVVVICWYDAVNKNLVLSYDTPVTRNDTTYKDNYSRSSDGMTVGNWSSRATTISTDGGLYCRMAIDANDGIHIAHYSNSGADLLYTYVPCTNGVPQMASAKTVVVDSFLSVGTNCTIDVAKSDGNYVPYIGYYAPSNQDTSACARIAYPVKFSSNYPTGAGANGKDLYTGNWEITTVPTTRTPIIDRVNVGVYKVNGVLTAIPGGSTVKETETNDFPVSDSTKVFGNGTTNPAVAYAVDEEGVLEMAQKK